MMAQQNKMTAAAAELDPVEYLFRCLAEEGGALYGGEAVTQLEHALQAADLAYREGASDALVAAALLHDVGHLLADDDGAAESGHDLYHEEAGARFVARHFPQAVSEPIRLHVDAKRYLCAIDPDYFATLSPASVRTLVLQGGPFDEAGATAFRLTPFSEDAVKLRFWDDLAKDPEADPPPLAFFRPVVERARRRP